MACDELGNSDEVGDYDSVGATRWTVNLAVTWNRFVYTLPTVGALSDDVIRSSICLSHPHSKQLQCILEMWLQ